MYIRVISLMILATVVSALPEKPDLPVAALCDHYREKCETKMKKANCKQRASECLEYADNGLRVTWSFCMFMNNDNERICRERAMVDFEIIKTAVMNDSFKYDFAD